MQEKVLDPFVVYENVIDYSSVRGDVTEALYSKSVEALQQATQVITHIF